MTPASSPTYYDRWQRFSAACVRGFHAYANWLVSISWKRFFVLSLLVLIGASILESIPPFTWRITEQVDGGWPVVVKTPPAVPSAPRPPKTKPSGTKADEDKLHYDVQIDDRGIRIKPVEPSEDVSGSEGAPSVQKPSLELTLPASGAAHESPELQEARQQLAEALKEVKQAQQDVADAKAQAEEEIQQAQDEAQSPHKRVRVIHIGEFLPDLAMLLIVSSALIKMLYKGRIQAEVKAAQAEESAQAEQLKRQVVEARMAAMQAQVEPHFLFNTLASIEHLIETDPPRAALMQRHLIALLRAAMPTMREANASGLRDLGREMAVIHPYLEILRMRMEERLQVEVNVPDGLLSAEFPPMMIQSLVENAIKHGLEPKTEGGTLKVSAEIVHGKLAVTVADTGLGFGRAATAGTGVGLANIRERLLLLYGNKAQLTISDNPLGGTITCITVPYRSRSEEASQA
ncbi:MAG: histidine kinase [Paucibacter sp.]|nr:histidine kinase [Roseateles sp.]